MTDDRNAQQKGYDYDDELAAMIGGVAQPGSGNRVGRKLDAAGNSLLISGKYKDSASFSLKETDLDEMVRAVLGPEATDPNLIPILAIKYRSGRQVAVLDLQQLLEWIRQPPELIPASKMDSLRATARTPGYLR